MEERTTPARVTRRPAAATPLAAASPPTEPYPEPVTEAMSDPMLDAMADSADPATGPLDPISEALASRPANFARQPFGAGTLKLAYATRPGFHRHWFNDSPGRIDDAEKAGYTVVTDRSGKPVQRPVDRQTGLKAFLMEIPQEWRDQDMETQQARVDETDIAISEGNVERRADDGRYVPLRPDGNPRIDIQTSRGRPKP